MTKSLKVPWFVRLGDPLGRRLLAWGVPMGPNRLLTIQGRRSGLPRRAAVGSERLLRRVHHSGRVRLVHRWLGENGSHGSPQENLRGRSASSRLRPPPLRACGSSLFPASSPAVSTMSSRRPPHSPTSPCGSFLGYSYGPTHPRTRSPLREPKESESSNSNERPPADLEHFVNGPGSAPPGRCSQRRARRFVAGRSSWICRKRAR